MCPLVLYANVIFFIKHNTGIFVNIDDHIIGFVDLKERKFYTF